MIKKTFIINGVPDKKYFEFGGKIKIDCPSCKKILVHDFSDKHLEYIDDYIGNETDLNFYCNVCDKDYILPFTIESITCTVKLTYDKKQIKDA